MPWLVRSDQNRSTLTHYGVKGMKWGVRRTPEELGHQQEIRESVKGNVNLAKELFGDPIFKLPRPKLRNEKANYYVNKGIDYLEPYMSPKGVAFLAVSAIVPGFGIGTILAGQAAIDTGLADAALAGLTAKDLKDENNKRR